MSGSRKRSGRPKTHDARLARRFESKDRYLADIAAAPSLSLQVAAAAAYARSALKVGDPTITGPVAAQLVRDLLAAGDHVLNNGGKK